MASSVKDEGIKIMSTEAQLDWPKLHYFLRSLHKSKHVHLFLITVAIWRNYNNINSAGVFLNTLFQCLIVTILKKLKENKEWGIQEAYLSTDTFTWNTDVLSRKRDRKYKSLVNLSSSGYG